MIVDADMEIVMSLCEVCPSQDTTGVAEILLICFESRGKIIPLLKAVIQKEISLTGKLFFVSSRRSSVQKLTRFFF
jgi:hypothetical protein